MDASDLSSREEFYFANCIAIGRSAVVGYRLTPIGITVDEAIEVDMHDMTNVFELFSVEFDGSIYGGGEASAHGSCGYFFKKTNDCFDWVLMSLDHGPFVTAERCHGGIRFVGSSGVRWVVLNDDLSNSSIDSTEAT